MRSSVLLAFLLLAAEPDARELHWRELAVRAHLDDDGTLRVSERHAIIFTGDWNGGERTFRVEPHQTFTFHGIRRGDGTALVDGDLDAVDEYQLRDGPTLRWRSRLPTDPPFARRELVYVIDYTVGNILVPDVIGSGYRLDHDFAFADRAGDIERFTVELTLGPNWSSPEGPVVRREARLPPRESYVLRLPLEFHGATAPGSMSRAHAAGKLVKPLLVPASMLVALAIFLLRQRRRETTAAADDGEIDRAWIERNVLSLPPEVAGTFLHGDVGPPEVAALLARMEQEGKIRTRVERSKKGRKPNLHLELLVAPNTLTGGEHAMATRLFFTGTATDTESLRRSFRGAGFDPPALIRHDVLAAANAIAKIEPAVKGSSLGCVLLLAGLAGGIAATAVQTHEILVIFLILFGGLGLAIYGLASTSRARIYVIPVVATVIAFLVERMFLPVGFSVYAILALTAAWLGVYLTVLASARERLSPEAQAIRKMLRRAQRHFRRELKQVHPAIDDAWTPWLIALGLDRSIAAWWQAHGRAEAATSAVSSRSSSSASPSPPPGLSFTGGGGAFGGAGATGTWAAAAIALATPAGTSSSGGGSSGSSSSGSSGGSSSGGGGGGGW